VLVVFSAGFCEESVSLARRAGDEEKSVLVVFSAGFCEESVSLARRAGDEEKSAMGPRRFSGAFSSLKKKDGLSNSGSPACKAGVLATRLRAQHSCFGRVS